MNVSHYTTVLVFSALSAGCAGSATDLEPPAPAEIPALEARVGSDSTDIEAGLHLASGYREAGRVDDARELVESLTGFAPDDPGLLVMQGLLAEDAGDYDAAVGFYQDFMAIGEQTPLLEEVERRLEVARLEALRADVRDALSRESALAQTEPDPGTVGIFPFVFEGADPQYEPLSLVLAELLTTDLGITGRLTVIERTKIQALVNELQLGESGRVEEATAARSGRLLGSAHIVQGRFRIQEVTRVDVDASVVTVGPPGQELADPLATQDEIERFLEMEKRLAFAIYDELGVQLTPAERELVNERQTESIEALLAFGRGLAAADAGDFGQARQHYAEAAALDPSFALARTRLNRATMLSVPRPALRAAGQIARQAHRIGSRQAAVRLLTNAPASMRQRVLANLGAQKRAVLAELLGQDRVGQVILLELVFRGPGGQE
ncbi:MAG: hypothetical protein HKN72_00205 [Gemmatimonadetes bacterium]|nr:hypothetical protein [Gemmatimonadota bacterium]NNF11613.1 hypothetical protein [Gemmatimonadota bacterium]